MVIMNVFSKSSSHQVRISTDSESPTASIPKVAEYRDSATELGDSLVSPSLGQRWEMAGSKRREWMGMGLLLKLLLYIVKIIIIIIIIIIIRDVISRITLW